MQKHEDTPKKFPLKREEAEFRKSELLDTYGNYHVEYDLTLILRKSNHLNNLYEKNGFEGRLEMKFAYFGTSNKEIFLNFNGDICSVVINGEVSESVYRDRRVYLDTKKLRKSSDLHDLNVVVILFSARYDKGGVGLHHFIDPMDKKEYLYTQFEPYECHLVFPVFDQPDIKANLKLTLSGPSDWVLLSNEYETWTDQLDLENSEVLSKLSYLTENEKTFLFAFLKTLGEGEKYNVATFKQTPKISSYLYAICAGPYHCITDPNKYEIPLRIFMRESLKHAGEPAEFFRITIAGMEWYKKFFGLAYPFNKYDQIYTPEYNFGAMENVGLVTYNEAYCWTDQPTQAKRSRFCITVLHELAHMWFGNLVTMKWWDDLWLNESFATFISFLCQSQCVVSEYPTSWSSFNSYKGIAYREDQKSTTHPVMGDITDTDKAQSHFDAIVYYKGSSLLKQMFYFIGEENFSNGLKAYFTEYAWTNTVFNDFVDMMTNEIKKNNSDSSEIVKHIDLKLLSNNWLTKSGLNQIEASFDCDDNKITAFRIKQTPCLSEHPYLQVHMIDVLFVYENKNTVFKNILINAEEITLINSLIGETSPEAIVLNFNDWGYVKWIIDPRSLDYLKSNLQSRNLDTLTRQLFYRSIFDLARDAQISCPEYLDVILSLLEHEVNEDILSNTLRQISGLISSYMPIKYYSYYSSQMFNLVLKLIANNHENKEIVLNLLELLIVFAHSEDHMQFLMNWLIEGVNLVKLGEKISIPDNMLNQDIRFSIVAFIHRSKCIDLDQKNKLLETEILRDKNSDRSIRARCKCRAALPDSNIKKELWNKFVNEPLTDSLYNMKSYMAYFASVDQLDIVEEFLKKEFFEVASKVGEQEFFYVTAFVSSCGPVYFVEEEIIGKLEKLAEDVKENDVLRRPILELADDMKRFHKAQVLAELYKNKK